MSKIEIATTAKSPMLTSLKNVSGAEKGRGELLKGLAGDKLCSFDTKLLAYLLNAALCEKMA